MPAKRTTPTNNSSQTNPSHLVLSTGEPHPPFVQEVPGRPGQVERCEWDPTINGYRCQIIGANS
jgi:hypothetical protein